MQNPFNFAQLIGNKLSDFHNLIKARLIYKSDLNFEFKIP